MFVSQTDAHKYVNSLLPHKPYVLSPIFDFFLVARIKKERKKEKNLAMKQPKKKKKRWAKHTIKTRIPAFHIAHFLKKKKEKHSTKVFLTKSVRLTFFFWPNALLQVYFIKHKTVYFIKHKTWHKLSVLVISAL